MDLDAAKGRDLALGIDVGAGVAWVVALEVGTAVPTVCETARLDPFDVAELDRFAASATCAGIDAPGGPSVMAHAGDTRIVRKFRTGRCSEIALSRAGIGVPFVTPPADATTPAWMRTGFEVWRAVAGAGAVALETYPHGVFWRLNGSPVLRKRTARGADERRRVLERYVELPTGIEMWGHDGLDALAAAYVAWLQAHGQAVRIDCGADEEWGCHDGSSMWMPPEHSVTSGALAAG